MKYIVTAIICTFIGAAVIQLNADEPARIYGKTYENDGETFLDSVEITADKELSADEFYGNTKTSDDKHTYKADTLGSTDPDAWHFYIDGGNVSYIMKGHKDVAGGYWAATSASCTYPPGGKRDLIHTFFGSE